MYTLSPSTPAILNELTAAEGERVLLPCSVHSDESPSYLLQWHKGDHIIYTKFSGRPDGHAVGTYDG